MEFQECVYSSASHHNESKHLPVSVGIFEGTCGGGADDVLPLLNTSNVEKERRKKKPLGQQQENRLLVKFVLMQVIDLMTIPCVKNQQIQFRNEEHELRIKTSLNRLSDMISDFSDSFAFTNKTPIWFEAQTDVKLEPDPLVNDNYCLVTTSGSEMTQNKVSFITPAKSAVEISYDVEKERPTSPCDTKLKVLKLESTPSPSSSPATKDSLQVPDVSTGGSSFSVGDDKEFDFLKKTTVRRSSSLKSSISNDAFCRKKKKEVRFADALGLDLESVKHITVTTEPQELSIFRNLKLEGSFKYERIIKQEQQQGLQLFACFEQPHCHPDFMGKVFDRKVMLENVTMDDVDLSIAGFICVVNIAYEKCVIVRYTTNRWLTQRDFHALYVGGLNGGRFDRFHFSLSLPRSFRFGGQMEFAVRYQSARQVYWDNNFEANYRVEYSAKQIS